MKSLRKISGAIWLVTSALLGSVLLGGCGPKFLDGYVVTKEYTPAHEYKYVTTIMVGKAPISQLHTGHRADKWTVTIAREKWGNEMETIEVTKTTFDEAKRGQMIFLE